MSKKLIITLQGKGGISKSTCSIFLHQYLLGTGKTVLGFDTDPNNQTYKGFTELDVESINISTAKHDIDPRKFDNMMERIVTCEADVMIIDSGATSFNPLMAYFGEADIWSFLQEHGIEVIINSICAGGSEHNETMKGLKYLHDVTKAPILVFMNSYFGDMPTGKYSPEPILRKAFGDRLLGVVNIPDKNSQTFAKDIQDMLAERLTFEEFTSDAGKNMIPKHRINTFKKELYAELDKIEFELVAADG